MEREERRVAERGGRPFNVRAFVALTIAVSGLGLPITGVANHLEQFSPLTVTRHAWMSAHGVLGAVFLAFSVAHAVLNRRALVSHTRRLVPGGVSRVSREAVTAAALVAGVVALFVSHAFHVQ